MSESIEDIIKRGVEPQDLLNAVEDAIEQAKINIAVKETDKRDELKRQIMSVMYADDGCVNERVGNADYVRLLNHIENGKIPFIKIDYDER